VLDAQPLVALIADEPIAESVARRLRAGAADETLVISAVNWCEVLYMSRRLLGPRMAVRVAAIVERAPVAVIPASAEFAAVAAEIKARFALGLGDSFAAALAIATGSPLLTGDADFLPLAEHGLVIEWVGEPAA
jgi:uncharacterized protein with PIN domain